MKSLLLFVLIGAAPAFANSWVVQDRVDKMTGQATGKSAHVDSIAPIRLEFPYQGPQPVRLAVSTQGDKPNLVLLFVARGIFECPPRRCTFRVRFDDGPVEDWPMFKAQSASSGISFEGVPRFIERLRASKSLKVEAQFYRSPSQVVDFDVSGLVDALPAATP